MSGTRTCKVVYDLTTLTYIDRARACAVESAHGIARCG